MPSAHAVQRQSPSLPRISAGQLLAGVTGFHGAAREDRARRAPSHLPLFRANRVPLGRNVEDPKGFLRPSAILPHVPVDVMPGPRHGLDAPETLVSDVNYSCRSTTTISAGSGHVLLPVPRPPSSPPASGSCRHLRGSCRRSPRPPRATSSPVPRSRSCRHLRVVVVLRHSFAPTPPRPRRSAHRGDAAPVERGAITERRGRSLHPPSHSPRGSPWCAHANETSLLSTVATRARSRGRPSYSLSSSFFFLDSLRFFASSARTLSRSISMIAA
jgi:hypothetical protein